LGAAGGLSYLAQDWYRETQLCLAFLTSERIVGRLKQVT
jgi:hypothetical protein